MDDPSSIVVLKRLDVPGLINHEMVILSLFLHCVPCVRFATLEHSGLLIYNGRLNEKHDFLAVEIVNGQVHLKYSTGAYGRHGNGIIAEDSPKGQPVMEARLNCITPQYSLF